MGVGLQNERVMGGRDSPETSDTRVSRGPTPTKDALTGARVFGCLQTAESSNGIKVHG